MQLRPGRMGVLDTRGTFSPTSLQTLSGLQSTTIESCRISYDSILMAPLPFGTGTYHRFPHQNAVGNIRFRILPDHSKRRRSPMPVVQACRTPEGIKAQNTEQIIRCPYSFPPNVGTGRAIGTHTGLRHNYGRCHSDSNTLQGLRQSRQSLPTPVQNHTNHVFIHSAPLQLD